MKNLKSWTHRPAEEANLFNPAFLCALSYEFIKDYSKERPVGAPLTLIVISLSASLHTATREGLPNTTITYMYGWLQDNEKILVGFADRTRNILPYIKQAIMFGIAATAIRVGNGHCFLPGQARATFTRSFLDDAAPETKDIIQKCKFLARWFAKSGSEVSIAAAWGVKP